MRRRRVRNGVLSTDFHNLRTKHLRGLLKHIQSRGCKLKGKNMVTIRPYKTKAPRTWTKRRAANAAAQMSAVCLVGALLAWIAGFEFDHRSPIVAGYSGLTLLCAVFFAWVCATE